MIDFSTLQGLTIPEGAVTQITDASGKVLWKLANDKPIILEVEKITSDTYAAETAYTGEQFILLDIYPKKNGTVTVTYGGLTKTITDTSGVENPNAQQVFFGTFNGVSDSVATPASGTLTIDGQYDSFAIGAYSIKGQYKTETKYCGCITGVTDWGNIESIKSYAFRDCLLLTNIDIPSNITTIGFYAFYGCTNLVIESLPNSITNISSNAFYSCTNLALKSLPNGLKTIGSYAFYNCTSLALTSLPSGITSIGGSAFSGCTNLALTSLPSGITSIADNAFEYCTNLALTSLPSGITSIGYGAFYDCENISITEIPYGVTSIGNSAFHMPKIVYVVQQEIKPTKLTTIILPETIQSIGSTAFAFALGDAASYRPCVSKITMLATVPPTITNTSFGSASRDSNRAIIVVPKGYRDIYCSADVWKEYAAWIVEAS